MSAHQAKLKAAQEYEVFRKQQDAEYISDFDKAVKRFKGKEWVRFICLQQVAL